MKVTVRIIASTVAALGFTLLAWVAYDATDVRWALGLGQLMDEAAVALLGLGTGVALVAGGFSLWLRTYRISARQVA